MATKRTPSQAAARTRGPASLDQLNAALPAAIFSSTHLASIITDADGIIQAFSVGAEQMLGYAAAEVVGKLTPADLAAPEEVSGRAAVLSIEVGSTISRSFEALAYKAARGVEDVFELSYLQKNGSRCHAMVSITPLRGSRGEVIGFVVIGTEHTTQKRAQAERTALEQKLRDQQFYTRSLVESNIDALFTTDARGIITDVNKQTEALTGHSRDELIGSPFKTFFTDPGQAEAGIHRVLRDGQVTNCELVARGRDGALTIVSYNATTFYDRFHRLQGVFASARDVTALKRYEHALEQKNAELEHAGRTKSEFLANMSHELRTPLNAIIGFSEVLGDGLLGELTAQQREFVADIFSSGKHLLSLINDIIDLSSVEAGVLSLALTRAEVSSLFVNSFAILREKATRRHLRLVMDQADELGTIVADTRKVKQIVYNLLSNAVKFAVDGGHVTLRVTRVPRSDVGQLSGTWGGRSHISAAADAAEFLKIVVMDNGVGIAPARMERLFEPFTPVDGGLPQPFERTGLGLAMVKLLAELHGGAVAVESAVGEGSHFAVWLPLPAESASKTADAAPFPAVPDPVTVEMAAGPPVALVVEDDQKSAELLRVQLEAEGFRVHHEPSGEAGLSYAAHHRPSLITLDILLPDMDGWELLGRLKRLPAVRRTPVVIISIVADQIKGYSLGAAAVMQKPIARQELYESLVGVGLLPGLEGRA